MHTPNEIIRLRNDTNPAVPANYWFVSCGCGWWKNVEVNERVNWDDDERNARAWWVDHMQSLKTRFDGRIT